MLWVEGVAVWVATHVAWLQSYPQGAAIGAGCGHGGDLRAVHQGETAAPGPTERPSVEGSAAIVQGCCWCWCCWQCKVAEIRSRGWRGGRTTGRTTTMALGWGEGNGWSDLVPAAVSTQEPPQERAARSRFLWVVGLPAACLPSKPQSSSKKSPAQKPSRGGKAGRGKAEGRGQRGAPEIFGKESSKERSAWCRTPSVSADP